MLMGKLWDQEKAPLVENLKVRGHVVGRGGRGCGGHGRGLGRRHFQSRRTAVRCVYQGRPIPVADAQP